jgi:hypothetical protein
MENFKKLLSIITAPISRLATSTSYLFSSGYSSDKNENFSQPYTGSKLAKDWLPLSEEYGTAFFRPDCTFTLIDKDSQTNSIFKINGTYTDLTPGENQGEVVLTIITFEMGDASIQYNPPEKHHYRYLIDDKIDVLCFKYIQKL